MNLLILCCLFLMPTAWGQLTIRDALCPRIYIRINTDDIAVKVLEGVYLIQNYTSMDFPVYKSIKGPYVWYYYKDAQGGHNMLLGSDTDGFNMFAKCYSSANPVSWRDWWSPTDYPFNRLINYWQYYDSRTEENKYLGSSVTVQCVTETFGQCSSGRLYFNDVILTHATPDGKSVEISNPDEVYFEEIQNISIAARPVFRKIGGFVAYLYYSTGSWVVSVNYDIPDIFMRCYDTALRPEYLACTWELYTNGNFQNQRDLNLQCRGSVNGTCTQNQTQNSCQNGGFCSRNTQQEVVCNCPRGYHGENCQFPTALCPQLEYLIDNSLGIISQERYVGDMISHICVKEAQPAAVFSLCVNTEPTPIWKYSNSCVLMTTVPATSPSTRTTLYPTWHIRPSTTSKAHVDLDEYDWIVPTVAVFAILLQIVVPIIVHFIWAHVVHKRNMKDITERTNRLKRQLSKKEIKKRKTEINDQAKVMFNNWGDELNAITSRYSTMSGDDMSKWPPEAREQIDEINNKYRRQTSEVDAERKELDPENPDDSDKPKKKFYWKNVSFARSLSLNMFISFWLWMTYVAVCYGADLHHRDTVYVVLLIIGFTFIGLAWIIMSCESLCSREKQYLSTLGDVENARVIIESMRGASPVLSMKAVAWHMEQRTQLVTRTDANGNISTSTQTIWVRVDTAEIDKVFEYGFASDHSDKHIDGIRMTGVTKIKMNLNIMFGDEQTEEKFDKAYRDFEETHRNLDVNVDFSQSKDLPGFKKRVATYMDENTVPCWMNMILYGIMSFFALSWVFRIAFRCSVAGAVYDVNKKVYLRKPEGIEEERLTIYASPPSAPNEVDDYVQLQEQAPRPKQGEKKPAFVTLSV